MTIKAKVLWHAIPCFSIMLAGLFFFRCEERFVAFAIFCLTILTLFISAYHLNWYERIAQWSRRNNLVLKWTASIYPGLAAAFLIFFKEQIIADCATGVAYLKYCWGIPGKSSVIIDLTKHTYSIDYWTSIYLLTIILWPMIYMSFVVNETISNRENISDNRRNLAEIKSAVLRVPNPKIFGEYNSIFKSIIGDFNALSYLIEEKKATLKHYEACFKNVLTHICDLTAKYIQNESATYRANIMVYVHKTGKDDAFIAKTRSMPDRWIHLKDLKMDEMQGILHTVDNLIDKKPGLAEHNLRPITLPVTKTVDLPGACMAAIKGESIIDDVTDVDLNYKGCAKEDIVEQLKQEARAFFISKGTDVKSFISIVIPRAGVPPSGEGLPSEIQNLPKIIGVLNIDCNQKFVLGEEKDYHKTYYCLVKPIISHLSLYMSEYLGLYLASQIAFSEPGNEKKGK